MYTAIYKINYFIPLKPLYIRRERNKKLFPKLACHKLCFFHPGSYCYICGNVLNRLL